MKRIIVAAALMALIGSASAVVNGNRLLASCEAPEGSEARGICKGFIMGAVDLGDDGIFCIPAEKGVTYRQVHDMVLKTLRDVPAIRAEPATDIISAVLMSTYPCAPKPTKPLL